MEGQPGDVDGQGLVQPEVRSGPEPEDEAATMTSTAPVAMATRVEWLKAGPSGSSARPDQPFPAVPVGPAGPEARE